MNKLIVVESPTKAKTISRFLKDGWQIMATKGHIRDLPKKRFGVKITENGKIIFEPQYQVITDKKNIVNELKEKTQKADQVILASDPDREGEAIAYHAEYVCEGKKKGKDNKFVRISFHEITKKAIEEALNSPRQIDMNLVDAQQARRVLDRIVGYKLSPLLWRKVRRGLSAGRVQSVGVRLIVEREKEIEKFKEADYFRIWSVFKNESGEEFLAELEKINGKSVVVSETFALFAGKYRSTKTVFGDLKTAEEVIMSLPFAPKISSLEEKIVLRRPIPPHTTSKLQQEASRRMGWSSKLTMQVAQQLYEKGIITYHRTDSTTLSSQFLDKAREFIGKKYGHDYLPEKPVLYKTKSRLAQEAHEAIRPTDPGRDNLSGSDQRQEKLYRLIWQRAVASQMKPAKLAITKVKVEDNGYLFSAQGTRVVFDGFSRVYPVKFSELTLPVLKENESLGCEDLGITSQKTSPPPRYSEPTLIAALEKEGIGRPSTYAPIISIIQARGYVEKDEGKFKPTNLGVGVSDLLVKHFPDLLNLPFTVKMEAEFDEIAEGKREWMATIGEFWKPFIKEVDKAVETSERVKIEAEKTGEKCPECKEGDLVIRVGKYGKFIACSRYPECKYTKPLVLDAGFLCEECGAPVVIRRTKRGKKFYGCSNWPSCKWASWKKPKAQ